MATLFRTHYKTEIEWKMYPKIRKIRFGYGILPWTVLSWAAVHFLRSSLQFFHSLRLSTAVGAKTFLIWKNSQDSIYVTIDLCIIYNVMYRTCQESKAALMTKSGVRMKGTTYCGKKHCKKGSKNSLISFHRIEKNAEINDVGIHN